MLNGVTHMATIGASGHFATTFTNTAGLTVTDSPYAVSYNYAGDGTFSPTSTTSTLTVTQAVPTVSVADTGGTYDASPFPATGSVAGVSGVGASSLEGVDLQVAYYSGSHWRGIPSRTAVHIILLVVYTGWAAVYLTAGLANVRL